MAIMRHEDGKDYSYDINLLNVQDGFQWSIRLEFILDEGHKYETTNRPWRSVGPEFKTRAEGLRFLGLSSGLKEAAITKNWDKVIEEYNGLFSDEIESHRQFRAEEKKFGRPSQGRTERMQFSATPELRRWLESQMKPGENTSLITFRLLEELRKSSKTEQQF